MNKVKYIGIIYGGNKSQTEINLDHAKAVGNALKDEFKVTYYNTTISEDRQKLVKDRRLGKLDIIFNNSAGKKGGDGTVEGFLDILDVPYVGSGMLATALAFDKKTTKRILLSVGIPHIKDLTIGKNDWKANHQGVINRVKVRLGFPVIVKASGGTDSIAVKRVNNSKELAPALTRAFREDDHVIIEQYIQRMAEVSCMVFGNGLKTQAFKPVQWAHLGDILKTREKFIPEMMIIPPKFADSIIDRIKKISVTAHRVLGCNDYSRSDLIISKNRKVYFLEINAHAGLGVNSSTVRMAAATKGWDHSRLVKEILHLAIKRNKI